MERGSVLKAAAFGGVLAGLVSSLPILGLGCCAFTAAGGCFAAWVLHSDSAGTAGAGRLALAGWLAGALAGGIWLPLMMTLTRWIQGEEALLAQAAQAQQIAPPGGSVSPELLEAAMRGALFIDWNLWSLVWTVSCALIFSFFGLIGGLVGSALFSRRPSPAGGESLPGAAVPPAAALWEGEAPDEGSAETGELSPQELPELPPTPTPEPEALGGPGTPDAPDTRGRPAD